MTGKPLDRHRSLYIHVQPKEHRMNAVEIAVKALIDITQEDDAPASVRCDAAQALVTRDFEGVFAFADYNEQGQKATA